MYSKKLIDNRDKYFFHSGSYLTLLSNIIFDKNDFIFLDPPYLISSKNYTKKYWSDKRFSIEVIQSIKKLRKVKLI